MRREAGVADILTPVPSEKLYDPFLGVHCSSESG